MEMAVHESQRIQGLETNPNPGQNHVPLIFPITVRPAAGFTPYDMAGTGAGLFTIRFHTWGCMKIIV